MLPQAAGVCQVLSLLLSRHNKNVTYLRSIRMSPRCGGSFSGVASGTWLLHGVRTCLGDRAPLGSDPSTNGRGSEVKRGGGERKVSLPLFTFESQCDKSRGVWGLAPH